MVRESLIDHIVSYEKSVSRAIYRRIFRNGNINDNLLSLLMSLGSQELEHIRFLKESANETVNAEIRVSSFPSVVLTEQCRNVLMELLTIKSVQVDYYKRLLSSTDGVENVLSRLIEDEERGCINLKSFIAGETDITIPQVSNSFSNKYVN